MSLYAERGGFDVFTPESHVPLDIVRRRARSPFDDRGGGQDSKKRAERGSEEDLDKHHPSRSRFCAATLVYTVIPDLSYEIFREPRPASSLVYTNRLCALAAAMKLANSG